MFFLIKLIFKLATLAVFIFIGVVIYSFLTGKNIEVGAAELVQVEKVEFEDGSYVITSAVEGWCTANEFTNGASGAMQKEKKGRVVMGLVYNSKCEVISKENVKNLGFLVIMPFDFSAENICRGKKQSLYELGSLGGKVKSCIVENEDAPSGYSVAIHYPISVTKSILFGIDAQLWKEKQEEILSLIKTTKYIGAN